MSYQSVVLSKLPFFFGRLDELTGTVINDISGNGYNGTYFVDAVKGLASPIETDAASRSVGGRVGTAGASAPAPLGAFSWGGWGYFSDAISTHAGIVCRNGQFGLNKSNFLEMRRITGVECQVSIGDAVGEHTFTLSYTCPTLDRFYRALVTRNASTLRLYVNGYLRAERTDLPAGNITLAGYLSSTTWKLGSEGDGGGVWYGVYTDEIDLYSTALSAADELEIYEAALANPPLSGRADLRFNSTLDSEPAEDPKVFSFAPNWKGGVKETFSWLTDVLPADEDYEQRISLRRRPRRTIEYTPTLASEPERRRFDAFMFANQEKFVYQQLRTERSFLTAAASIGATTISFDAVNKEYFDLGYLALFNNFGDFEIVQANVVSDASTTLVAATTKAWTTLSSVVPLSRALLTPELSLTHLTDTYEDLNVTCQVKSEDVPLTVPKRGAAYTPRYTYKSLEVFDPFVLGINNYRDRPKGQFEVRVNDPSSPVGTFSRDLFDTAPRQTISYTFTLSGRPIISSFFAWLWSIKGKLTPLWVPTRQTDFDPISSVGNVLTVKEWNYSDNYLLHKARRDLVFIYKDKTMIFRRITASVKVGANEELTLSSSASLTNIASVSFLRMCRLKEDSIDLEWKTDTIVETTVNFVDLLTSPV